MQMKKEYFLHQCVCILVGVSMLGSVLAGTALNGSSPIDDDLIIPLSERLKISKQVARKRNGGISFTVSEEFRKKHIRTGDCSRVYSLVKEEPENFRENLRSTAIFWNDFTKAGSNSRPFSRTTNAYIIMSQTDTFEIANRIEYIVKQVWGTCQLENRGDNRFAKNCLIDMAAHGHNANEVAIMQDIQWEPSDYSANIRICNCGTARFTVTVLQDQNDPLKFSIFHFNGQDWYVPAANDMINNLERTEKNVNKNSKKNHRLLVHETLDYRNQLIERNPNICH